MDYLSIGQMAALNGISVRALHHYQDMGIIDPVYVDAESNRRYYDLRQSAKIDFIQQLQSIGCSLDEISELNKNGTIDDLRGAIDEHLADIDRQIEELQAAKRTAQSLEAGCVDVLNKPLLDQIIVERLPERRIISFPITPYAGCTDESGLSRWEQAMRETKQQFLERELPLSLFHDLGSFINHESVIACAPCTYRTFVFVDESHPEAYAQGETLPAGTYLTLYFDQAYDQDGRDVTFQQILRLQDYAQAKHMEIGGDIFTETLCRFPHLLHGTGEMLFRICMPVKTPPPAIQGNAPAGKSHSIGRRIAPSRAQGSPGRLR